MNKLEMTIENERKKCLKLDEQYAVYEARRAELEKSIEALSEYQKQNSLLIKCKEKESQDLESLKKEFSENQALVKERKSLLLKLTQIKQEHYSIKQSYNDLLNKKKDLECIEVQLHEKNSKLKDEIKEIAERIEAKEKEKKELELAYEARIEQEVKLRKYYEDAIKGQLSYK